MVEVLKQALDAFHQIFESTPVYHNDGTCIINDKSVELSNKAIASLRQAIAELESQEPVAHRDGYWCADLTCKKCYSADFRLKHTTHPPQRTEERNFCPRCGKRTNDIHTCTPPQRTWVGLTDEEKDHLIGLHIRVAQGAVDAWIAGLDDFIQAIETKLKEKNT